MPNMTKSAQAAREIKAKCEELGWECCPRGAILTIAKDFIPGSKEEFTRCDGEYWEILKLLPTSRASSTWGTDGSGMDGAVALNTGRFVMNKSGGDLNVLRQLTKL